MERDVQDATERVGQFEFSVEAAPPTPESEARWQQRAEILANWLISEWDHEQKREAA
jgi:hypothetical protein